MTHRRRTSCPRFEFRALAWTATLLCATRGVNAASYYVVNGLPVTWPGNESVRYLSPSTFPEGSVTEILVFEAMALWTIVPSTDFQYYYNRLDQEYAVDHFDGYNDTTAVPADQLDPGVLGVTYLVNDGATWFDTDVLFSSFPEGVGYNFDPNPSCDVLTNPKPSHGYSFLLIATHELGHALGLGHDPQGNESPGTPWFATTMNPRYPSGGPMGMFNIVELHTDDRNGLRLLYPPSGPSPTPMIDLASAGYMSSDIIGKAIPLTVEPPVAYPGEEVFAGSVIENLGSSSEYFVRQGFYLSTDETLDAADALLGALLWDVPFQDAFEFEVAVTLPDDLPAGAYYLGARLDDLVEIAEEYEDNNDIVYCDPVTVGQLPPVFGLPAQLVAECGRRFMGPTPVPTHPLNMSPITWSLDSGPDDMTIDATTGEITWPRPVPSTFLYVVTIRATNAGGASTRTLFLGVTASTPSILAIDDHAIACQPEYIGPTPRLTSTTCMEPILNWSLDTAPEGMTVDHDTGVVTWPEPVPAATPYTVTLRATNAEGNGTTTWHIRVTAGDLDGDADIDLSDYRLLLPCLSGPSGGNGGCTCADGDLDGDVDLEDLSRFLHDQTR